MDIKKPSITCPECNKTSYCLGDIQHKFCIQCGFHSDILKKQNKQGDNKNESKQTMQMSELFRKND